MKITEFRLNNPSPEVQQMQARLDTARRLLAEREAELLEVQGPCSHESCDLHYAHRGPCRIRKK